MISENEKEKYVKTPLPLVEWAIDTDDKELIKAVEAIEGVVILETTAENVEDILRGMEPSYHFDNDDIRRADKKLGIG